MVDRLADDRRVQDAAVIGQVLGMDPLVVLAEPDPVRRVVRTAAALSLLTKR